MKKFVFMIISALVLCTASVGVAEDIEVILKKKQMHSMKTIGDYHVKAKYQLDGDKWTEIDVYTEGRSKSTAGARVKARVQKMIRELVKEKKIDRPTATKYKKNVNKTFTVLSVTKN